MSIFVAVINHGVEGKTAPFQAFSSKGEAISAYELLCNAGSGCIEIFEIPVWPETNVPWWQIEPVWPLPEPKSTGSFLSAISA